MLATTTTAHAQDDDALAAELAVPGGLRAQDVVRAVVESSFDRRARLAEIEAARADVDRATLALVPRVGLSASYMRLSEIEAPTLGFVAAPVDQTQGGVIEPGSPLVSVPISFPVLLDQTQVRAQLVVPVSDYFLRVLPGRDAAEHVVHAGEATLEATEARLALEAEQLYWGWARARLSLVVARTGLSSAEAHRDDAQRVFDAGLATGADVSRAEAQVAAMRELVDTTEHLRDALADRLRTVMHVSTIPDAIGDTLPDAPALHASRRSVHEPGDTAIDDAVAGALERRAELRAIGAQVEALEAQRIVQDAALVPRLDVIGEVLLANPNPRFVPAQERFETTWAVGAQVSWQLADALSADPSRRALESRIAAARASRESIEEGVRAEIVDADRQRRDAVSAMTSRHAQVDAAERALRQASEVFRAGRGTGLPVIDAQTLLVRARLELLNARIDLAVADARWRRAIEE
ncbi:outer membrane efflux protein [Sandaracinus amylolyticus]|uniref:Outer membrane efflux protein n=1 Tax=Sandaracinus amylolyticus TaxID=927083 RepID=A0A0F6YMI6_9BACT|nr:outer membrane efflux protein [Sandaracinus amylolyticus]